MYVENENGMLTDDVLIELQSFKITFFEGGGNETCTIKFLT